MTNPIGDILKSEVILTIGTNTTENHPIIANYIKDAVLRKGAKLLVIDAEFVSVGSTNFDIRSIRLNDEASLNIYSSEFATQMTAVFEADLPAAKPYSLADWKSRPWREKLYEKLILPIRSQL